MKMLEPLQSQRTFCLLGVGTSCSILGFFRRSQVPLHRVQHSHLLRSILLASGVSPPQALCTDPWLWCLHHQLCGQELLQGNHTLLRLSGKTSSVSACQLTITDHRLGTIGSEAVSVPCVLLRISFLIYLRSHKSWGTIKPQFKLC